MIKTTISYNFWHTHDIPSACRVYAFVCACMCLYDCMFRSSFNTIIELITTTLGTVDDGWHGENHPVAVIEDRVDKFYPIAPCQDMHSRHIFHDVFVFQW